MSDKPNLPEDYKVPKVWKKDDTSGTFGKLNRPVSGATHEKDLEIGEHPYQLYSLGTPNGVKVTVLLEELGVEYDAWKINIMKGDQFGSGFVKANPNSKIPVLVDHSNKDKPIRVFESGNILLYLAEKHGKFIPKDVADRVETLNWLFWLQGSAPFIGGGFGHFFNYAPINIKYAIDRFTQEFKRLLDVLDKQLEGKTYVIGDEYTIADIAIAPWILAVNYYKNGDTVAKDFIEFDQYKNVIRWLETVSKRPAFAVGKQINGFQDDSIQERHSKKDTEAAYAKL